MDLTWARRIDALNLEAGRDKNILPNSESQLAFQQYLGEKKAIRNADANARKYIEMWEALPKRWEATPISTEKK